MLEKWTSVSGLKMVNPFSYQSIPRLLMPINTLVQMRRPPPGGSGVSGLPEKRALVKSQDVEA
jgi:hypothetical protein